MARDLAGEERVLLAHAVLDEGVADAARDRRAAGALDDVGDGARGAQVVEDRLAGVLGEHRLGDQRRDEVARHELAGVVDEEAAVGVAVPGDAEVGAGALDLADDELAVLLEQRVRLVVRERAVGLEVAALGAQRQALEDRLHHRARPCRWRRRARPAAARSRRRRRSRGSAPRSPAARRAEPRLPGACRRAERRLRARGRAPSRCRRRRPAAARRGARSSCRCTAWDCARR